MRLNLLHEGVFDANTNVVPRQHDEQPTRITNFVPRRPASGKQMRALFNLQQAVVGLDPDLTRRFAHQTSGTPDYIAPEQIVSAEYLRDNLSELRTALLRLHKPTGKLLDQSVVRFWKFHGMLVDLIDKANKGPIALVDLKENAELVTRINRGLFMRVRRAVIIVNNAMRDLVAAWPDNQTVSKLNQLWRNFFLAFGTARDSISRSLRQMHKAAGDRWDRTPRMSGQSSGDYDDDTSIEL